MEETFANTAKCEFVEVFSLYAIKIHLLLHAIAMQVAV